MIEPLPFSGKALARWRRLNGHKQSTLSGALGVAQTTISRWERGLLVPEPHEQARLVSLMRARPDSGADRALKALVEDANAPVHLVCDLTHRLLAVSRPRARQWQADLSGQSLWRYASDAIIAAEHSLEERGWYAPMAEDVAFVTERAVFGDFVIVEGEIVWSRFTLSDGSFARLVRDGGARPDA